MVGTIDLADAPVPIGSALVCTSASRIRELRPHVPLSVRGSDAPRDTLPACAPRPASARRAGRSSPCGSALLHGGEVRVRHHHLVAQLLQATRHPLALGRRLDQDPRPRPLSQYSGEPLPLRSDPPLHHLPALCQDADLASTLCT